MFKDERFNHDIDQQTGYKTRSLLCMPIKDINGEVIGVAQVRNRICLICFSSSIQFVRIETCNFNRFIYVFFVTGKVCFMYMRILINAIRRSISLAANQINNLLLEYNIKRIIHFSKKQKNWEISVSLYGFKLYSSNKLISFTHTDKICRKA